MFGVVFSDIIWFIAIGLIVIALLYTAFTQLKANNIFMKNPSRDPKDRIRGPKGLF